MGRGLRTAVLVEIVVLVAALVFSIAYFRMGLRYQASHVATIVLVALWVLVAAILLFVFWTRVLKREEMIRRIYLNDEWIYNHEIGYAPVRRIVPDGDAYELVTFAAESLAKMSYGFEVADAPDDFKPEYLVISNSFLFHIPEVDPEDVDAVPDDADEEGVVIDRWTGVLQQVVRRDGDKPSYEDIGRFENAGQLARLLEDSDALA